ncbi:AlbA family DNA-binding domain-containing protein [Polaribacter porphyrae]|uniref:AlbA family DNA-binding domain-containing protein n=1 Tax=Polaribacter porphyrae TaxID=1137780 RepID=UPI001D000044|nr:ATP-binding protein [Polaribacter porphyrae]
MEFKAVLPPARSIARLISSFANASGGYIILGISDRMEVNGLSQDFHANNITHKALDLLTPTPKVEYQYINYGNKKLYVIKIEKSNTEISLEGKIYKRINNASILTNPLKVDFSNNDYQKIKIINQQLNYYKENATNSRLRLVEHYQSILKIIDDLQHILYPETPQKPTISQEGKVLTRILYSSFTDNFETYLSELLYEIFLANPSTLKSKQEVTIEEVLNCSDLQDFVKYWANQKIGKLQKGSVKNFIKDNKQIRDLDVINESTEKEIELLLQIRHLYTHRNGIVDEKFLKHYKGRLKLNDEYQVSIDEVCDKLVYLSKIVYDIDNSAIKKYNLAIEK